MTVVLRSSSSSSSGSSTEHRADEWGCRDSLASQRGVCALIRVVFVGHLIIKTFLFEKSAET